MNMKFNDIIPFLPDDYLIVVDTTEVLISSPSSAATFADFHVISLSAKDCHLVIVLENERQLTSSSSWEDEYKKTTGEYPSFF